MKIENTVSGDVEVVKLIGIVDTSTAPQAETKIQEILDNDCKKMIINLGETEYMSSSGLRVLLSTAKKLWAVDGSLRICQPNKVVKDILDTSGFSVIMDVRESEDDAMTDF